MVSTLDLDVDMSIEPSGGVKRSAESQSRRRGPVQEKLRIALETLEPGVSVPVVARRHCVYANQMFIWRSQYRRGELGTSGTDDRAVKLLPVKV